MGFLGALAGAGQGMQGYAGMMRENQKLNWQNEQDIARHEREVNLQSIRAKDNRDLAEDKMKYQSQEADASRAFETKERKAAEAAGAVEFNRRADQQVAMLEAELKTRSAAKIADAKTAWEFTETMSKNKRDEQVETVRSSPQFAALSEDNQQKVLFSLQHPEAAKSLTALNKIDKFPAEQYNKAYMAFYDKWDTLPADEKVTQHQKAMALGITDTTDLRDFYASSQARRSTGLDRMIEAGVSGEEGTAPGKMPMPEAIKGVEAGTITIEHIKAAVADGTWTQGEAAKLLAVVPQATTGAMTGPTNKASQYGKYKMDFSLSDLVPDFIKRDAKAQKENLGR